MRMVTKHARDLVGRAPELAELDEALDRVAGGEPWFLQIVGEPGIGKSRLLMELAHRAEARGCLVLEGRAAEFEQDIPFGLIVAALNDYLGSLDGRQLQGLDQDALQELASIFPSFPRPNGSTGTGDGAERYRLHYSIRAVLEELARRQPLVLALDDIHWADAASIEVITHLLRRFRGPLLTAVAYRHAPARLLATLAGGARVDLSSRIDLAPLTANDATELIGANVDDATRAMLYRESGGNPFYIEQLARSSHGSRDQLPGGSVRAAEAIPPAVIAAIHEQLMSVSDAARLALEAAAVAGESFEPELIAAIAEMDEREALKAVDELLDFELLQATEAPRRFRFRHPIVRRAVYDRTARGWQIGAHARAAVSLAHARVPASAIAHHVEASAAAGDEQAIALLTEAGREVAPRAPEAAGRWLLAATRLLPQRGEDDDRRVSLLFEAASALTFAGAYDEALAALEEIGGLLSPACVRERAELVVKIAFATRMSGRPLETRTLITRALEDLPRGSSSALALRLELALDHYWRGEFAAMREVAEPVLAEARARGETLFVAFAAALCSTASSSLNRPGDALAELNEALEALDSLPDERIAERIDIAGYVAQAASALERIDDALECIYRGKRLAEATGQTPYIPGMLVQETNALFMKGRIGEAKAVAETTTDAAVLTGNDQFAVWALWADAMACSCAGDTTRALTSAREAVARAEHVPATFFSSLSRLHLAAALHAGGDLPGARAELARFEEGPAQQLLDLRGGQGWELLILTQLAVGELDAAVDSAARAEARARTTSLPQRTVNALSASAAVSLARGDPTGAIERAREAIALASAAGNPLLGARARALLGTALGRQGETQEGIAELEQAERTLLDCGALREADAAARELRRLGHRGRRRVRAAPRGTGPEALSPREAEIATLVAAGKRNRDVAAVLFLSEKTVESHLARIYDKVGVHSRAALTAIIAREAIQTGAPPSSEPAGIRRAGR